MPMITLRRMTRRLAGLAVLVACLPVPRAAAQTVTTVLGTGVAGMSDAQVNNPYGIIAGPDGALYFCDLDNQRIRRFDPTTKAVTTVAGNGSRGYSGDGGPALQAGLNMPHEIQFDRDGTLLICDIGNQRIRRLHLDTGIIETWAGTGVAAITPDGAPISGTPLRGPRTMAMASNGDLFLALREGNAILRIDATTRTFHRVAGTGEQGYAGDGGPALAAKLGGPKGLAWSPGQLFVADTENHAIRRIDLATGIITTVLGTGVKGDGPETAPLECKLSRPHGLLAVPGGVYVTDSEAHRIRLLR